MPSILTAKLSPEGELVISRFGFPSGRSTVYEYEHDDKVSELNMRSRNRVIIKRLVNDFRAMEFESENGFRDMVFERQYDILLQRKKDVRELITEGDFYQKQFKRIQKRAEKIVESIYIPYIENYAKKTKGLE